MTVSTVNMLTTVLNDSPVFPEGEEDQAELTGPLLMDSPQVFTFTRSPSHAILWGFNWVRAVHSHRGTHSLNAELNYTCLNKTAIDYTLYTTRLPTHSAFLDGWARLFGMVCSKNLF